MYLKKLKLEVTLHTIFSDCKNLQKYVLTKVNIQRTGKTSLQMFVYFIFEGSHICRCLYIFRPSSVPRHSICSLQLEVYTLIISYLYLQILHSASESRFCVGKWFFAKKSILYANMACKSHDFKHLKFRLFLQIFDF